MSRYIVTCHNCELPTDEQVFVDRNKSIQFACNHSNELKHCCSVMEEGPTIQISPLLYQGSTGKFIAFFISGRKTELLSNTYNEHNPIL